MKLKNKYRLEEVCDQHNVDMRNPMLIGNRLCAANSAMIAAVQIERDPKDTDGPVNSDVITTARAMSKKWNYKDVTIRCGKRRNTAVRNIYNGMYATSKRPESSIVDRTKSIAKPPDKGCEEICFDLVKLNKLAKALGVRIVKIQVPHDLMQPMYITNGDYVNNEGEEGWLMRIAPR